MSETTTEESTLLDLDLDVEDPTSVPDGEYELVFRSFTTKGADETDNPYIRAAL